MKGNALLIALMCLLIGSFGCLSNTFEYPDRDDDGRIMEEDRTFFIGGLIDGNDEPVQAHELCNGPVKSVETVHTFGDQCIGCITGNIYTPNTVNVTCAAGEAHNFYLDENDSVVGHEVYDTESGEVLESEVKSDYL